MKLLIVYEHQILADGLKVILELNPHILSVNLLALEGATKQHIQSYTPDILLIDCSQSLDLVTNILAELSTFQASYAIILLGANNTTFDAITAAKVFQLNSGLSELLTEIRVLGHTHSQKEHFELSFIQRAFLSKHAVSQREAEVLSYIIRGESSLVIAEKLFISVHTVNTHKRNIYQKLKVSNERDLVKCVQNSYHMELQD